MTDKKPKQDKKLEELKKQNHELQIKIQDLEKIAAKAQSQYISLKWDFDIYVLRTEKQQKESKIKNFVEDINSFLPIFEELRKTVENIPDDIKDNSWVKWVVFVYENMIKKFEDLWVSSIKCIWCEPDTVLHEPIWTQKSDEKNKWKIIKEFEKWFVYKAWDEQIIIKPAKVIVWE